MGLTSRESWDSQIGSFRISVSRIIEWLCQDLWDPDLGNYEILVSVNLVFLSRDCVVN